MIGIVDSAIMTLLSDIVRTLHDAQLSAYSVHSAVGDLPGEPDLVVTTEGDAGDVTVVLATAVLPIGSVKQISREVVHVWVAPTG